mgnify:CR=1 FL=1|jgi:muramidase (phage lysozyme)
MPKIRQKIGSNKYSLNSDKAVSSSKSKQFNRKVIFGGLFIIVLLITIWSGFEKQKTSHLKDTNSIPPLVMTGGNPYIRALMRTISTSEAKDVDPYTLLYGGKHFTDLSRHPNQCITIVSGPHQSECSTAAGRYQILTSTWQEKVKQYRSKRSNLTRNSDNFEPQSQDEVVYAWLKGRHAWKTDIAVLLEQGRLDRVLQLLSGTWTSLGYGTENNLITPMLSKVYQKVLAEELN